MVYIECQVKKPAGLRPQDVIAEVVDYLDRREQIQVEKTFLVERGGRHFLPVWGVAQDHDRKLVEVELPQESASGTNRIWVKAGRVFVEEETAA
jgi:hypothetical protein